jgi:predicted Na+-dependent transporter
LAAVCVSIVCGLLQGEAGIVFETSDQKTQGFLVLITLKWLFFKHTHKLFGEMPVRTWTDFYLIFVVDLAHALLASIIGLLMCLQVPNPVSRADSFL